jgi:hypothetical protein
MNAGPKLLEKSHPLAAPKELSTRTIAEDTRKAIAALSV